MKSKLIVLLALLLASPTGQALACATCMGAKDSKSSAHLAVAIWVMIGAVMSVLAGVSAFGVHLWRHANVPLEPRAKALRLCESSAQRARARRGC